MKATIRTTDGRKHTVTALVDSGCTHTAIAKDLVERKRIPTERIAKPFNVFNADGTKSGKKTIEEFVPMELSTNGHTERVEAVVADVKGTDIYLGHDWLVTHNPRINWKQGTIQFTNCPDECSIPHQDVTFEQYNRRLTPNDDEPKDADEVEKEPDPTNPEDLPHYIQRFTHLFNKKKFEDLPQRREWDHAINLTDDAPKELNAKAYPMTAKEEETLNAWLDEHLESGLIVESSAQYAAPCFFIPKKDGSLRLVQDYRRLNQHTVKDKTPLPLIGEVVDKLKEARFFNKLDLIWGYNNVRIRKGDEWKAAFLTNKGLFEPQVMFFGMSNSPATFQRMMTSIFRKLLHEGVLANYMDDFVIPATTEKELEERTIRFLEIADKHNLCFKRTKCEFNATEIPILGVRVGRGEVKMENEKIKAIQDWETPKKVKDVESFLGFVNFYRRFIRNFSDIAVPLNRLKGKQDWKWEEEEQNAFETLKARITEEPVLALPQREGQFRVEVDASGYAIGGVLSQEQAGKWRPIAFLSRTMIPAERNYEIYDKELLAIVEALKVWRQYLLDAKERFEIWTDHENLKYYREPQKLNGRQARWYLKLQDYDFTIRHVPGKTNTKADILSRKYDIDNSQDNLDVTLLKEGRFLRTLQEPPTAMEEVILRRNMFEVAGDEDLLSEIKKTTAREQEIVKAMKDRPDEAWEREGIAYLKGRVYVPNNKSLRARILEEHHEPPDIGHPGQHRMLELLKRTFWWPSIRSDVKRYVKGCDTCQRNKARNAQKAAPLHPLPIPEAPWEEISIDMIGPLPKSGDYDAILVIVDRFSKMIRLFPTETTLSSGGLAKLYRDEIWKLHGIPKRIISDRGPQFASRFMKELCDAIGTRRNLSTAYHPQTDGQTERINREVETFIRHYVNYAQDNWKELLATAEFQYNDKAHTATEQSPFFLNYGRHPWKGNLTTKVSLPSLSDFLTGIDSARQEAKAALKENNDVMEEQYNRKRRRAHQWKQGDRVWLEGANITTNRPSRKLGAKRYGPFEIKEKIGEGAYRLEIPEGWVIHNVFNEALLSPFSGPEFDSQRNEPPPPPDILNDEEEYEVEEIRGQRKRGRGTQYLVHWKGYTDEHDQWLSRTSLEHAAELIQEYHNQISRTKAIKRGGKTPK